MITIHHLSDSQSGRVVWLCEELGIPYRLVCYDRDPATQLAPVQYKALHPAQTAPVITEGGVTLAESGAVVDYIIARHGEGRLKASPEDPHFADYLFWFHFANGSIAPSILIAMVIAMAGRDEAEGLHALGARADTAFSMVEQRLGEADYFAGSVFTAADIMMHFPISTRNSLFLPESGRYPNLLAYLARIALRPAYARAVDKVGARL